METSWDSWRMKHQESDSTPLPVALASPILFSNKVRHLHLHLRPLRSRAVFFRRNFWVNWNLWVNGFLQLSQGDSVRRKCENALGTCKEKRCVYMYICIYSLHILYTLTYAMNMRRLLPARLSQYLITHTDSILHSYVTCFISKLQETHLTISRHEVYAPCQRKPHWWYANFHVWINADPLGTIFRCQDRHPQTFKSKTRQNQ